MKRGKRSHSPSVSHEDSTIASLGADPEFGAEYLNAVLEDGDQEELMVALRRLAAAYGGVAGLAKSTRLNATSLYRTLSRQGNPELRSLSALLEAMGMRLAVRPIQKSSSR